MPLRAFSAIVARHRQQARESPRHSAAAAGPRNPAPWHGRRQAGSVYLLERRAFPAAARHRARAWMCDCAAFAGGDQAVDPCRSACRRRSRRRGPGSGQQAAAHQRIIRRAWKFHSGTAIIAANTAIRERQLRREVHAICPARPTPAHDRTACRLRAHPCRCRRRSSRSSRLRRQQDMIDADAVLAPGARLIIPEGILPGGPDCGRGRRRCSPDIRSAQRRPGFRLEQRVIHPGLGIVAVLVFGNDVVIAHQRHRLFVAPAAPWHARCSRSSQASL